LSAFASFTLSQMMDFIVTLFGSDLYLFHDYEKHQEELFPLTHKSNQMESLITTID
jgi:hypothetical protein